MDNLHFLDTNIILAMVLPNDNSFEESELYLSKNYQRHISNTACLESKEKIVVIDLYKEKNDIVIYIENSINKNNKIDLSKMKVKGFSTKGSNRGYGLYIVDKLLNKNKQLELSQNIDKDKFVSILKIKK